MPKRLRFPLLLLLSWILAGCAALGSTPQPAAFPTLAPIGASTGSPTVPQASTPTRNAYPAPLSPHPSGLTLLPPSPAPPTPSGGWSTYTSAAWRLAIDVPGDWSVSQELASLVFTSPGGETITLAQIDTNGLAPEAFLSESLLPNQRCTAGGNPAGLRTYSCLDTLSRSHVAYLIITGLQGEPRLLALSTARGGAAEVFNAMLASLRPAP